MDLLDPQELVLNDHAGKPKKYILSRFPAVQGRKIVTQYPLSNIPKIGDYNLSEQIMFSLMSFVAVEINGEHLRLTTEELINNHVSPWENLAKIEMAMMEKNCSFFTNGRALSFWTGLCQNVIQKTSEILTNLLAASSQKEKQPITNSEQSTH